jgi:hypothetical protein
MRTMIACLAGIAALLSSSIHVLAQQDARINAHAKSHEAIACQQDKAKPVMVCIGARNIAQTLGDRDPAKRVELVYSTTRFRMNASQVDYLAAGYEQLYRRRYERRLVSTQRLVALSGAHQKCRSFDTDVTANNLAALSCAYPIPPLFDFQAWLKQLAPHLDSGALHGQITSIFEKHKNAICRSKIKAWLDGNRAALFIPIPSPPLSSETVRGVRQANVELEQLKSANNNVGDEMDFMMNVLASDCDSYL